MKKLRCKLIGHDLKILRQDHHQIQEYQCRNCQSEFTQDGYGNVVRLNKYWQENNRLFQDMVRS